MPSGLPKPHEPLRILVADDNRDSAQSMAGLLSLWGHEVRPTFTHQDAIAACRDFRPDVLLLDLGFPLRTDGLLVARTLREEMPRGELVIAAVTGFEDQFTREEAARVGVDQFFVKPVAPETLRAFLSGVRPARVSAAP